MIWLFMPFPPPASGWFMAKGIANWHQVGFWDKSSLMVPVMCKICMLLTVRCTLQNLTVSFRYMNMSLVMMSLTHSLLQNYLICFIWAVINAYHPVFAEINSTEVTIIAYCYAFELLIRSSLCEFISNSLPNT